MSEIKTFDKGTVIFKQGDVELKMYDIVSGKVGIYANYKKKDEKLLAEMLPGSFFGEMGLIDMLPRSATAVALEDSETRVIDQNEVQQYLSEHPEKAMIIIKTLSKRLRGLTLDYMDACNTIARVCNDSKPEQKKGKLWERMFEFAEKTRSVEDAYNDSLSKEPSLAEYMEELYGEFGMNPYSIIRKI